MPDDHPTPEMLDRLLAGASTSEESTWGLAHLVGRCETCSRYVRGALARAGRPPAGPEAYDQVFASSLARSSAVIPGIHAEQLEAAALWATIEGTPEPLRWKLIGVASATPGSIHSRRTVQRPVRLPTFPLCSTSAANSPFITLRAPLANCHLLASSSPEPIDSDDGLFA